MAKRTFLFGLMLLASFAAGIRLSYAEDGTPSSKDFEGRHGLRVPARFQPPTAEVDGCTMSLQFRSGLEGMEVRLEDAQGGTAIYEGAVSGMSGESVELPVVLVGGKDYRLTLAHGRFGCIVLFIKGD